MNNLINHHFVCECACVRVSARVRRLKLKAEKALMRAVNCFPFFPSSGAEQIGGGLAQTKGISDECLLDLCRERESGRKIKVVTVCAHSVPGHAEWFIWNKQNPKGLQTLWSHVGSGFT